MVSEMSEPGEGSALQPELAMAPGAELCWKHKARPSLLSVLETTKTSLKCNEETETGG